MKTWGSFLLTIVINVISGFLLITVVNMTSGFELFDLIDSAVSILVEFMGAIFTSYKDGIYERASLGFHESSSFLLYMTFLMLTTIPFYIVLFIVMAKVAKTYLDKKQSKKNDTGENTRVLLKMDLHEKSKIIVKFMTLFIVIITIFVHFFAVSTIAYTNRVVIYSMRSLDIVKPYVPENEHNKLVSQFYQVRNTNDYNNFNKKIINIATIHSLRLPKNAPL